MKRFDGEAPILPRERNDCTVHALMNSLRIDYDSAYRIAEFAGRRQFKGAYSPEVIRAANLKFPGSFIEVPHSREWYYKSLSRFVDRHPVGRFYLSCNRHAIALIDGEVIDTTSQYRQPGVYIRGAWVIASSWIGSIDDVISKPVDEF